VFEITLYYKFLGEGLLLIVRLGIDVVLLRCTVPDDPAVWFVIASLLARCHRANKNANLSHTVEPNLVIGAPWCRLVVQVCCDESRYGS
jgi:hypothetical protein